MSTRRNLSRTERVAIFLRAEGRCHICGDVIDGVRDKYEIEHVIPLEMGGDEAKGSTNLQPAHVKCHRTKTSVDAWQIAKAKRRAAKHVGARPKSKLSHSTLKRKVSGEVVPR